MLGRVNENLKANTRDIIMRISIRLSKECNMLIFGASHKIIFRIFHHVNV